MPCMDGTGPWGGRRCAGPGNRRGRSWGFGPGHPMDGCWASQTAQDTRLRARADLLRNQLERVEKLLEESEEKE